MPNRIKTLLDAANKTRDRATELTSELVKFNTTSPQPGGLPFDDEDCQRYVAEQLKRLGFKIDLWQPEVESLSHYPFYLAGQNFNKRPMMVATLNGKGSGRSLILNAHIDAVPADESKWKHGPWSGESKDGKIFGRGSCDMKGGAAAIIAAAEVIQDSEIDLKGDLVIETVLDEEVNGMGTVACIERGYRADAAIIPEPSNLNLWIATRGLLWAKTTVEGRSGHAEFSHPSWQEGGAVNAIEKATTILNAFRTLESEWKRRTVKQHALLATPRIIPTIVTSGDFWATIPDRCDIELDAQYLPSERDQSGYGSIVKHEIEEHLMRACRADSWLAEHQPKIEWKMDLPPMELERDHPLTGLIVSATKSASVQCRISALDSWDDGAHLMNLQNTPSVAIGPGPTEQAHTVDEFVTIDSVVNTTKILALAIAQWCGAPS